MATQIKPVPPRNRRPLMTRRIAELASEPSLFEAQRWFSRERAWTNERHLQVCRIPAPTFFEQRRAEWFCEQLKTLGWQARLDRAGNVLAAFEAAPNGGNRGGPPWVALTAHLDTVLAPRPEDIQVNPDGRLTGSGVSDNGAGLAALLSMARVLAEIEDLHSLARSVLLVANVGEEGEGNLSGMRYLCSQPALMERIKAFVVLDGPSLEHITSQALASLRFEVVFNGPGGHSWNDHGTPNPIHALCLAITSFTQAADARIAGAKPVRCAYNFGIIDGGSSINSIASSARAKLDLRSEDTLLLEELSATLTHAVERALETHNRTGRSVRMTAKIKDLGSRPGGRLPEGSPLLDTVEAVDVYLGIRARVDCASTDANIPLSMERAAISIGTGGQGGGAHTAQEWYQPEGREVGLRRILLLVAALSADTAASESVTRDPVESTQQKAGGERPAETA